MSMNVSPGRPSNPIMPMQPVSPGESGQGNFAGVDPRTGNKIHSKPAPNQRPRPSARLKRKPSENFLKASARWRAHLADYRVKNPGQSLKKQMKGAKKTYRRSSQVKDTSVSVRPRRTRKTKRRVTRKKKKSGLFGF